MAPSGSGKGVLIKYLLETFPELHFAISCTTRKKRAGEQNGREYYFLTKDEFEKKVQNEEFAEWAEYGGNCYGTLKSEILDNMKEGKVVLNELELQGVRSLHQLIPDTSRTTIFIDGGGWETLKSRILKRAPLSQDELELRHERYKKEVQAKDLADVVIVNRDGHLDEAKDTITKTVRSIIDNVN